MRNKKNLGLLTDKSLSISCRQIVSPASDLLWNSKTTNSRWLHDEYART